MKSINNLFKNFAGSGNTLPLIIFFAASFYLIVSKTEVCAKSRIENIKSRDTSLSAEIRMQLEDLNGPVALHYPKSAFRFYLQNGFQPVWINPRGDQRKTWEAVLLFNCVLQFGLCREDYHPQELVYSRLHTILDHPSQVNNNEKARYEIVITDALLTFMNHLHFGKLNPEFQSGRIDAGASNGFYAKDVLARALLDTNFLKAVINVQPKSTEYLSLLKQMRHLTQFQEDCEGMPSEAVRKMAVNLERLRWSATEEKTYLQINIPSYTLLLAEPDTTYHFRVMVGKPLTPTPSLNTVLTDFTTASELKIPQRRLRKESSFFGDKNPKGVIYFWFKNSAGVSMQGRPEKYIFNRQDRALTNGGIRVEQGEKLAALLLLSDDAKNKVKDLEKAIADFAIQNFTLQKPVPLRITYITCEMNKGKFLDYKDVYGLDTNLEMALYNKKILPTSITKPDAVRLGARQ
jgi:L,D-transpeptidase YcbB